MRIRRMTCQSKLGRVFSGSGVSIVVGKILLFFHERAKVVSGAIGARRMLGVLVAAI